MLSNVADSYICKVPRQILVYLLEIAELRRRLRQLQTDFSAQEKEYNLYKEEQRRKQHATIQRARKEKNKAAEEAHQLEL